MKVGDFVRVQIETSPTKTWDPVFGLLVEKVPIGTDNAPWWQVLRTDRGETCKYHEKWIEVISESR